MNALYNFRTEMAAAALEEMKPRASISPLWYQLSIDVGLDQSIGVDNLRAIFDEGNAKFPDYLPLYSRMIRVLLPRWFGSYDQIDHLISAMDEKARGDVGAQLYARLYWLFARMEEDRANIFDTTAVQWGVVKSGFRSLLARYPDSDYLLNAFAHLACQADAVSEYIELRPALNKRFSSTAWSTDVSLKSCDDKFKEALKAAHLNF
jgi:hypothetical protein